MKPTLFRCPATGKLVQDFIADNPSEDDKRRFEAVKCNACGRSHMINRATGRALGQQE